MKEIKLEGTSVAKGIAIGKLYYYGIPEDRVPILKISDDEKESEILRFKKAVAWSLLEIVRLKTQLEDEALNESVGILQGQQETIQDPFFQKEIEEEIYKNNLKTESALHNVLLRYGEKIKESQDAFFVDRWSDLQDILRRMISYLMGAPLTCLKEVSEDVIVFAKQLTAANAAEANSRNIKAFITLSGESTSHAAIVVRSKGIPFVSNINIYQNAFVNGAEAIVNGYKGIVILYPEASTYKYFSEKLQKRTIYYKALREQSSFNPQTLDKKSIRLSANIDVLDEIELFHQLKGERVGLFRTELNFNSYPAFPQEEEQYELYRQLVKRLNGASCVIRTFDLGGDKCEQAHGSIESNPFLGCRAIRFLLRNLKLFEMQLRAIIRASVEGNVSILLPMISSVGELREAKEQIFSVQQDLLSEGVPCDKKIPIGCMVEVPSAAVVADLLAKECDFFCIGTNDLVQYCLAVDRGNPFIASLYAPCDPSVLRLLKGVINAAKEHNIPVSLCGEVAADTLYTSLFLGMGIEEFSISTRGLPEISRRIKEIDYHEAKKLAERALSLSSAQEVKELLEEQMKEDGIAVL